MARRIYSVIIVVAFGLWYYLYTIRDTHSKVFLILLSGLIFMLCSIGIHGLIAHSLRPEAKGGLLAYPLLMGALWAILFMLFIFFILPIFCPDFLLYQ